MRGCLVRKSMWPLGIAVWMSISGIIVNAGIYVSPDGDNSAGTNWSTAYTSIQTALDAAVSNDTVFLAGKTFELTSQIDWTQSFVMIRGGYAATNDTSLPGARDIDQTPTIIETGPDVETRILSVANVTNGLLEGVTIRNGFLTLDNASDGGGLYIQGCSDLMIVSCIITNNRALDGAGSPRGGGIFSTASSVTIIDSTITENAARHPVSSWRRSAHGGGIYLDSGEMRIEDSLITSNEAYGFGNQRVSFGGGVYVGSSGSLALRRTVVGGNTALFPEGNSPDHNAGGGIYSAGDLDLLNTLIIHNESIEEGDGIVVVDGTALIVNCTIANNGGVGLRRDAGSMIVSNSIVWANGNDIYGAVELFNSSIEDGDGDAADGCVSVDPLFVDEQYFHLKSRAGHYAGGYFDGGYWTNAWTTNSPLIDSVPGDYSNEPQPNGRKLNMGAYGNTPVASKTFLMEPGIFTELTVIAYPATPVDATTFAMWGEVLHTGEAEDPDVYICWGTSDPETLETNNWDAVIDMGTQAQWELFSADALNLLGGQTYYFRCFITNSTGGVWSDPVQTFAALSPPTPSNAGPTFVRRREAGLQGEIIDTGGETPWTWFHFWENGSGSTEVFAGGQQEGVFTHEVSGLSAATVYAYRIVASNQAGVVESDIAYFRTVGAAADWYVSSSGSSGSATNWSTAFSRIQDAIAISEVGDTICIAGQQFMVDQPVSWAGGTNVTIRGGFAAANDDDLPGPQDSDQWPTIIERDPTFGDFRIFNIDSVTQGSLEFVTIRNGYVTDDSDRAGGGIRMIDCIDMTMVSCVITNNRSAAAANSPLGGGLYVEGSDVVLTNCTLINNTARHPQSGWNRYGYGGGIYLDSGVINIENSMLIGNEAQASARGNARGGGVYVSAGADLYVSHTVIKHNHAVRNHSDNTGFGGGVYSEGTVTLGNVLLAENTATDAGCGVHVHDGTFVANHITLVGSTGSGVAQYSGSAEVANSIFWHNDVDIEGTVTLAYCIVENGEYEDGDGCFFADPLFVDTTYYHLQSIRFGNYVDGYFDGGYWDLSPQQSPGISAGDPNAPYHREPAPNGQRVNLGAYGNTPVASKANPQLGTLLQVR